jgi:hypothetical protein
MSWAKATRRRESRLAPAVAILAVLFLLRVLPARLQILPDWVSAVAVVAILLPMGVVTAFPTNRLWMRVEHVVTLIFFASGFVATLFAVAYLINALLFHPDIGGIPLLSSSVAIWATNVLIFSLLYWQTDRGGPSARTRGQAKTSDWLFPQASLPGYEDWRASFIDYLFLGFTAATAFSPTDTMPLTPRAKAWMMLQASISLVTLVVIAARAINILR